MKKIAKAVALDLWICKHFKVLPTDQRFLDLSEEQKYLLFVAFLEMPLDEWIYENHKAETEEKEGMSDEDKENLRRMGYAEEQIQNIERQLAIAREQGDL